MFFSYTCISKYMKYIRAYTIIYLYILVYTNMIILVQGVGIPDAVCRAANSESDEALRPQSAVSRLWSLRVPDCKCH